MSKTAEENKIFIARQETMYTTTKTNMNLTKHFNLHLQ